MIEVEDTFDFSNVTTRSRGVVHTPRPPSGHKRGTSANSPEFRHNRKSPILRSEDNEQKTKCPRSQPLRGLSPPPTKRRTRSKSHGKDGDTKVRFWQNRSTSSNSKSPTSRSNRISKIPHIQRMHTTPPALKIRRSPLPSRSKTTTFDFDDDGDEAFVSNSAPLPFLAKSDKTSNRSQSPNRVPPSKKNRSRIRQRISPKGPKMKAVARSKSPGDSNTSPTNAKKESVKSSRNSPKPSPKSLKLSPKSPKLSPNPPKLSPDSRKIDLQAHRVESLKHKKVGSSKSRKTASFRGPVPELNDVCEPRRVTQRAVTPRPTISEVFSPMFEEPQQSQSSTDIPKALPVGAPAPRASADLPPNLALYHNNSRIKPRRLPQGLIRDIHNINPDDRTIPAAHCVKSLPARPYLDDIKNVDVTAQSFWKKLKSRRLGKRKSHRIVWVNRPPTPHSQRVLELVSSASHSRGESSSISSVSSSSGEDNDDISDDSYSEPEETPKSGSEGLAKSPKQNNIWRRLRRKRDDDDGDYSSDEELVSFFDRHRRKSIHVLAEIRHVVNLQV